MTEISLDKKFKRHKRSIILLRKIYKIMRPSHKKIETELNLVNNNEPS